MPKRTIAVLSEDSYFPPSGGSLDMGNRTMLLRTRRNSCDVISVAALGDNRTSAVALIDSDVKDHVPISAGKLLYQ